LDSFPIQNTFRVQPRSVCRSTGRSTDPSSGRLCRSTVPNRELGHVSRSIGRSTDSFCGRPGGRPRWPVHVGAHRSTAWSTGVCCCCSFALASSLSTSSTSFLSLPTILHLGEDFSNLSRTANIRPVDSKVAAPVWLPTYPAQGIKPSVIHPKELHHAQSTWRIWSNALQCVNFTPDTTLVSISAGFSVV